MGSSPSQIATSMNNIMSKSILKSIQKANSTTQASITFTAKCNKSALNIKSNCVNECNKNIDKLKTHYSECSEVCKDICTIRNVDIQQRFLYNGSLTLTNKIKQDVKTGIENDLKQLCDGCNENQRASVSNNVTKDNIIKITQDINNDTSSTITLTLDNETVHSLKISQVIDITKNVLLENKVLQTSVQKVSTTIYQKSVGSYGWIVKAGAILIAVLILTFFVVAFNKSSDFKDFLKMNAAYLIFLSLVLIITIVHVLLKPAYVSYVDPESEEKKLMSGKLALYMVLYCFAIGIILAIVFKIISSHNSEEATHNSEEATHNSEEAK